MFIKIWVHEKIYINEMQTIRNIIRDIRRMMQIFYPRSFCVRNIIIHCYDRILNLFFMFEKLSIRNQHFSRNLLANEYLKVFFMTDCVYVRRVFFHYRGILMGYEFRMVV